MTTPADRKIPAKVLSVLTKHGVTAVFEVVDLAAYEPSDGSVGRVVSNKTVKVSPLSKFSQLRIDNETILDDDLLTIVPGLGLTWEPKANQLVTVNGRTFNVVSVNRLYSGDLIAGYEVQLRGRR